MESGTFIAAGAFDVVILPDDVIHFLLPFLLADITGSPRANPAPARQEVRQEVDLCFAPLGELGLAKHFQYLRGYRLEISPVIGPWIKGSNHILFCLCL